MFLGGAMIKLYDLVIDSQKNRFDLMKWKMLVSATIFGFGLGYSGNVRPDGSRENADLIICFAPLLATYIDFVYAHMSLRVQAIGRYLRLSDDRAEKDESFARYEAFSDMIRGFSVSQGKAERPVNVFYLEHFILYWSSIVISAIVLLYGVFYRSSPSNPAGFLVFYASAGVGFISILVVHALYKERHYVIQHISKEMLEDYVVKHACTANKLSVSYLEIPSVFERIGHKVKNCYLFVGRVILGGKLEFKTPKPQIEPKLEGD